MQNLVRNASKKFVGNHRLLKSARNITISDASMHINADHLSRIQGEQQLSSLCLHSRCYSTNSEEPPPPNQTNVERKIPKISDEPVVMAASLFSFITHNLKALKVKQYDREFSISEFLEGSKKAIEIVSDKLASADLDGLRGLVTDDIIDSLREKIDAMTDEQRQQLRTLPEDICKAILNDIELVEEDDSLLVKMTMVYHVVRGFADLRENRVPPADFLKKSSEFLDDNFYILNYKFVKEFSQGSSDDWIITSINHVNIRDEMMEQYKIFENMMGKNPKDGSQKK